jgi:hypothetical protein
LAGKVGLISLSLATEESAPALQLELELGRVIGRTVALKWAVEKVTVLLERP